MDEEDEEEEEGLEDDAPEDDAEEDEEQEEDETAVKTKVIAGSESKTGAAVAETEDLDDDDE